MYHGIKNSHPSSRMSEKHVFVQGGNCDGDSGLVLSTDAKPRLKWTMDLHERFIEAVNQLGGAESKYALINFLENAFLWSCIRLTILCLAFQKLHQNQF